MITPHRHQLTLQQGDSRARSGAYNATAEGVRPALAVTAESASDTPADHGGPDKTVADPALVLVAVAASGLVALLRKVLEARHEDSLDRVSLERAWAEAARRAGLLSPSAVANDGGIVSLAGNLAGFEVRARWGAGFGEPAVLIEVRSHGRLPEDLELGPEPGGARQALSESDVLTADPEFDPLVWVKGEAATIAASLDVGTRRLLQRFTRRGGSVEAGVLRAPGRLTRSVRPAQVVAEMRALVDLAQRLEVGADAAAKLARNALHDPVAQVRARCLELLAAQFSSHDVMRPTLRSALSDRDPLVRATAACHLGPEGRPVLLAIVAKAQTAASTLAMAVRALGADLPPDLLARLLRLAGTRRHPGLTQALLEALPPTVGPAVAAEVLGFAQACPVDLRPLALATVGRIGSVAQVLDLRTIANERLRPNQVRRAARDAIAAIQARTGAAAGDLALAEAGAGTISLATSDGRVSLPEHRDREPG